MTNRAGSRFGRRLTTKDLKELKDTGELSVQGVCVCVVCVYRV